MKRICWSFVICWVSYACSSGKAEEGNTPGQDVFATGSIKGVVSVKEDENILPDVGTTVYAVSTTKSNQTLASGDKFKNRFFQATVDAAGNYALDNLPTDTYTLVFSSKNAPKKLNYYKTRYQPLLEPLVSEMPVNQLAGKEAKKARLQELFQDKQIQVKPEVKVEAGKTQLVTQEFFK